MTAHNGCSPVTTVELLKHWQRATAKLQNDLRTSGGFETRSSELVAKTLANVRQKTEAALDHDDAQAAPSDAVREALELARKRIEYFGEITTQRHQEANEQYFLPPIDNALAALTLVSSTDPRGSGK